jgi:hypothetical protein
MAASISSTLGIRDGIDRLTKLHWSTYRFHLEYHLKLPFALDAMQLDFVMK